MKRTPLNRNTPLTAHQGLKRTSKTHARIGDVLLPKLPLVRARSKSLQIPDDVREAVWLRDGGMCVWCGHWATDCHHRQPRGAGGSTDPAINLPSNLVALCRSCHARTESYRSQARAYGLLVPRPVVPSTVRLFLRERRWVFLSDTLPAHYLDVPPAIEGTTP